MTKKRLSNLIVLLLCVVLLPFTLNTVKVKASDSVDAYPGVEFSFTVPESESDVLSADKEVIISVSNGEKSVELYKNGVTLKLDGDDANTYFFTSYKSGKVTSRITKVGTYTFTVSVQEDQTKSYSKEVTVHSSTNQLSGAEYFYDAEKLAEYDEKVKNASYVDATQEEKVSIFLDEDYIVPSVEPLMNLGSFAYGQYKRTVYYAVPGSTAYSTSSASGTSDLKFTVTKVGTYRFYVLLSIDKIDEASFGIVVKGLKEYADGFYAVKSQSENKRLYVSGTKYYEDEDFKKEFIPDSEEDVVKTTEAPIVPIFEFDIFNAGPKIKFESSDPEDGYIGLEYELEDVTVSGSDVDVNYKLRYKETQNSDWVDATEEFNSENLSFIPEKAGYYKVIITAIDSDGKDAILETQDIKVTKKYEKVEYKTGFNDWISVNYLPFIFLCISGACLIGIILLLTIKPKEKTEKVKVEEDK